ncbi:MAG: DUF5690 family protein [Pirellulales bacterium]
MDDASLARRQTDAWTWTVVATFGAYFCMYGLRRPFAVAEYGDVAAWGLAYKPLAIIAQVLGYMTSKFIGIRVIAELDPRHRVGLLASLIVVAALALVGFAVTPAPWNLFWLFVNGLPLGMVFGLLLGFLEGRRNTEALTAGLCTSFIVADGVTKSVGKQLLTSGVPEFWMPAVAAGLFALPLALFAWMLTRIAAPSVADKAARGERMPMDREERRAYRRQFGGGLAMLVVAYLLITILRSVRSDYAPEIWAGLGTEAAASDFAMTELLVAVGVLVLNGSAILIVDNRRAFFFALSLAVAGAGILLASTAALPLGLSPFAYMVAQGLGLYLPYIAVHTTIFERLIAMTRGRANIGYLMYLADAWGYLGYVAVLLVRTTTQPALNIFSFYSRLSTAIAIGCLVAILFCWRYFARHAGLADRGRATVDGLSTSAA